MCDKCPKVLEQAGADGSVLCVQTLISTGANVNRCNDRDITPPSNAAIHGCDKFVEYLIKAGADVNKQDNQQSWL